MRPKSKGFKSQNLFKMFLPVNAHTFVEKKIIEI